MLADDAVLHLNAGDTGGLELVNGAPDVAGVEPAVVHVADQGQIHFLGDLIGQGEQVLELHQTHVGQEVLGRAGDEAAGIDDGEAGGLDELGAEYVVSAHDGNAFGLRHQLTQANSFLIHIHGSFLLTDARLFGCGVKSWTCRR